MKSSEREADEYRRLRQRVDQDRNVVGFFLGGSRGKHFATASSDYDCYVVVRDEVADAYARELAALGPPLDVHVQSLTRYRSDPGPSWDRYNFAHLTVELDRLGGEIQRIVDERGSLTAEQAAAAARWALPAYTNSVYRSLKSLRDGRDLEARLDAAESINYFLTALFSAVGRVRPYNKLLRWDLAHFPMPEWSTAELLGAVERVISTADPSAQRELFSRLERLVRERGLGDVFADWRPDQIAYIRLG